MLKGRANKLPAFLLKMIEKLWNIKKERKFFKWLLYVDGSNSSRYDFHGKGLEFYSKPLLVIIKERMV